LTYQRLNLGDGFFEGGETASKEKFKERRLPRGARGNLGRNIGQGALLQRGGEGGKNPELGHAKAAAGSMVQPAN